MGTKDKSLKLKNNVKKRAIHGSLTKAAQAILIYASIYYMMETESKIMVGVVAFGLFWLGTEVALWVYNFIVKPSAQAIYKANS